MAENSAKARYTTARTRDRDFPGKPQICYLGGGRG